MTVKMLVGLAFTAAMLAATGCSRGPISAPVQGQAAFDALPVVTTEEQFQQQVLASPKPVLVEFGTGWCHYCKELAPTLGQLSTEYRGRAVFVRVDGDRSGSLVHKYGIRGYPTVLIFRSGAKPVTLVGVHEAQEYRQALENSTGSVETVEPIDKMAYVPTNDKNTP